MTTTSTGWAPMRHFTNRLARAVRFGTAVALVALAGCNSIVEVSDPDIIDPANLGSQSGALALQNGVLFRLAQATAGSVQPDAIFLLGGLLADEWNTGDTFEQRITTDLRSIDPTNTFLAGPFRNLNRVRTEARTAITALRQYGQPTGNIGLMFAAAAFAEVQLAESYCNGLALSSLDESGNVVYGGRITVDSVFKVAIANSDSALANTGGPLGPRAANFAAIVKARALLNRGQYAAAAAAVATVPTSFRYEVGYSVTSTDNGNWSLNVASGRYVVADREGTNGLNFVSAKDPRVPTKVAGTTQDGSRANVQQQIWTDRGAPIAIATGIEARLIEAEAALQANNTTLFLQKLNEARATMPGLAPLTDPGTQAARVDLLFRERAFWMFGTGHRLGDLRRLIRQYNRAANTVFPIGTNPRPQGGQYGTDVVLPMSVDELNNPGFPRIDDPAKKNCLDLNA